MREMRRTGLDTYVKERAVNTKILGICLGMQFLLEVSYEDGRNEGLGLIPGEVVRFEEGKIPQIGWNSVTRLRTPLFAGIAEGTQFYFVHSYRAKTEEWFAAAMTEYYVEYPSAICYGNVYGRAVPSRKERGSGTETIEKFCENSR